MCHTYIYIHTYIHVHTSRSFSFHFQPKPPPNTTPQCRSLRMRLRTQSSSRLKKRCPRIRWGAPLPPQRRARLAGSKRFRVTQAMRLCSDPPHPQRAAHAAHRGGCVQRRGWARARRGALPHLCRCVLAVAALRLSPRTPSRCPRLLAPQVPASSTPRRRACRWLCVSFSTRCVHALPPLRPTVLSPLIGENHSRHPPPRAPRAAAAHPQRAPRARARLR